MVDFRAALQRQREKKERQAKMSDEGYIPVNPEDLPTSSALLDESEIYQVALKRIAISPKADKNNKAYCAVMVEVVSGDFEGATLVKNYLQMPWYLRPEVMTKRELYAATKQTEQFGRLAKCFKFKGSLPPELIPGADNYEAVRAAWDEYFKMFYDNVGSVTIENSEFPQGSGRKRSALLDFIA